MSDRQFTGQQYLERMRQRRLGKSRDAATAAPTTTASTQVDLPVQAQAAPQPPQADFSSPAPVAQPAAGPYNEEHLLSWDAPSRPFKKRGRQYYTTIGLIVFLISLILFFAGQFLPIAVVISIAFLAYILASIPPDQTTYTFTTYGVRIDNNLYYWEEISRFWFTQKYGQDQLHFEIPSFPFRLSLLLGQNTVEDFREILSVILPEQQPLPTPYERAAEWLQKRIPLEIEPSEPTPPPTQPPA